MRPEERKVRKGVPQRRLNRLWEHLLKVEELAGMPLRTTPRDIATQCPIYNFAPGRNKKGGVFEHCSSAGVVRYSYTYYQIYTGDDSGWWRSLSIAERHQVTRWAKEKLKERKRLHA